MGPKRHQDDPKTRQRAPRSHHHSPFKRTRSPDHYLLRLPHRWTQYSGFGEVLKGTRFLPFKTPLKSEFFEYHRQHLKPEDIFDVKSVISYVTKSGKRLGLVIDLTATDRYYNGREWCDYDENIRYMKIKCYGHTAHKEHDIIQHFLNIVSAFLNANANNDRLIGVHCTHGLNRTSYMICRYLIEVEGWDADLAIKEFESCRGYKIERPQYIQSLHEDCTKGSKSSMINTYRALKNPQQDNPDNNKKEGNVADNNNMDYNNIDDNNLNNDEDNNIKNNDEDNNIKNNDGNNIKNNEDNNIKNNDDNNININNVDVDKESMHEDIAATKSPAKKVKI